LYSYFKLKVITTLPNARRKTVKISFVFDLKIYRELYPRERDDDMNSTLVVSFTESGK